MRRSVIAGMMTGTLLAAAGCGTDGDTTQKGVSGTSEARLALTTRVASDEAASIRVTVTTCAGEEVAQVDKPLEPMSLPGHVVADGVQVADSSDHHFADHFMVVPAGCFDVTAQPLDDQNQPLASCSLAAQQDVEVTDGLTTEIMLFSQCDGAERGGLDVIAAINNPPTVELLQFDKFTLECRQSIICAVVTEPDGDDVEFTWSKSAGPEMTGPSVVSHTRLSATTIVECASVTPEAAASYTLDVTVHDLDANGNRMEDSIDGDSRDTMQLPLHIGDDEALASCDGFDDDAQYFIAPLSPLNPGAAGSSVARGLAQILVADGKVTTSIVAIGLEPGMIHPQHIHGFLPVEPAECPPPAADTNGDGFIDVIEGVPFYGPILVPLDDMLVPLDSNSFPMAYGPHGLLTYTETVGLDELTNALDVASLELDQKHIVLHGISGDASLPASVASLGGLPATLTLPVACGPIIPVE